MKTVRSVLSWLVKHPFIVGGVLFVLDVKYHDHILHASMLQLDDEALFNNHLACFRDFLVIAAGALLVHYHRTIASLLSRPVLWPFFLYLFTDLIVILFMCSRFNLSAHPLTDIAIVTGLASNIILIAGLYLVVSLLGNNKRPIVFSVLFAMLLAVLLFDAIYFSYTNAHIEKLLFYNLNYHSFNALVTDIKTKHVVVAMVLLAISVYVIQRALKAMGRLNEMRPALFRIVGGFLLLLPALNFVSLKGVTLNNYFLVNYLLGHNFQSEKVRQVHRDVVATSPLFNLVREVAAENAENRMDPVLSRGGEFTKDETTALAELGIGLKSPRKLAPQAAHYRTIVLIIIESLHADFLHYYNPEIPASATAYFDQLLQEYPHLDNFFTSAMPTTPGLNAIFLSQIRNAPEFSRRHHPESLFSLLKQQGLEGYFVSGVSGDYGDEARTQPQLYKMDHFIAREELSRNYQGASGWGFHDDVIFAEGLRILQERRNQATLLVLKTIDLHQPGGYSGIPEERLPPEIRLNPTDGIRSLYWVNNCLATFFRRVQEEGLWRSDTLFVITADHAPPLGSQCLARPEQRRQLGRIPLIFMSADATPFKRLDPRRYASQIDIAPTLAQLLGIAPPPYFLGNNLLDGAKPGFAVGFYNEMLYYERERLSFSTSMKASDNNPGIRDSALRKWFNNMQSDKMPGW